jgi:hypothetical protein
MAHNRAANRHPLALRSNDDKQGFDRMVRADRRWGVLPHDRQTGFGDDSAVEGF